MGEAIISRRGGGGQGAGANSEVILGKVTLPNGVVSGDFVKVVPKLFTKDTVNVPNWLAEGTGSFVLEGTYYVFETDEEHPDKVIIVKPVQTCAPNYYSQGYAKSIAVAIAKKLDIGYEILSNWQTFAPSSCSVIGGSGSSFTLQESYGDYIMSFQGNDRGSKALTKFSKHMYVLSSKAKMNNTSGYIVWIFMYVDLDKNVLKICNKLKLGCSDTSSDGNHPLNAGIPIQKSDDEAVFYGSFFSNGSSSYVSQKAFSFKITSAGLLTEQAVTYSNYEYDFYYFPSGSSSAQSGDNGKKSDYMNPVTYKDGYVYTKHGCNKISFNINDISVRPEYRTTILQDSNNPLLKYYRAPFSSKYSSGSSKYGYGYSPTKNALCFLDADSGLKGKFRFSLIQKGYNASEGNNNIHSLYSHNIVRASYEVLKTSYNVNGTVKDVRTYHVGFPIDVNEMTQTFDTIIDGSQTLNGKFRSLTKDYILLPTELANTPIPGITNSSSSSSLSYEDSALPKKIEVAEIIELVELVPSKKLFPYALEFADGTFEGYKAHRHEILPYGKNAILVLNKSYSGDSASGYVATILESYVIHKEESKRAEIYPLDDPLWTDFPIGLVLENGSKDSFCEVALPSKEAIIYESI